MTVQLTLPSAIEKQTWTWRGYSIRYAVQGQGQPLVLLHGFGAALGHWRKNIPILAAAGYRVYALDLLGFGDSDKPAIDYAMELWEQLIHDFWQAHIRQPAVFVGNSIGGLMTLMTLAHFPETAAGGVLLNCAASLNHRPEDLPGAMRTVMGLFSRLVSSKVVGPFLFNQVRQKRRIRGSLRQVYANREAITEELVDLLYQPASQPGAQQVFASVLTAPPGPRPAELLPQVQQPLLILWGDRDPWTPLTAAGLYQALAADPERAVTFQTIDNTGHCPHDERPEVVNALILDWLSEQGLGSAEIREF
ncbi:alpha/beta fold hydrolase [Romeria aff. gracilis LEGE 07310]|uniref:Alpha/beta fold hydrolase n=1 Tax=Vasconcelosia minhoensis LEGE 07310 TaxID=915328 RepID=A0A8J7A9E6_9CYAN|nr:alpha/beta fold hydrolase [Romeria gracilis]MBE9078580.1 alpha/beta fold hydrolase [Romeria aff. gracilis LEGE 07310]